MIHMGFQPSTEKTKVRTNLDIPRHMVELLKNDWMLPFLEFEYFDSDENQEELIENTKPSLAYGGG